MEVIRLLVMKNIKLIITIHLMRRCFSQELLRNNMSKHWWLIYKYKSLKNNCINFKGPFKQTRLFISFRGREWRDIWENSLKRSKYFRKCFIQRDILLSILERQHCKYNKMKTQKSQIKLKLYHSNKLKMYS